MTGRAVFHAADGRLRAPWRLALFLLLSAATFTICLNVAALVIPAPWAGGGYAGVFAFGLAEMTALLVAHVVMLRAVERVPWQSVGLGAAAARARPVTGSFLLGAAAIGLPSLALIGSHWLRVDPSGEGSSTLTALTALVALAPSAFFEELAFRGYAFATLREWIGAPAAVVLTSVAFGLVHAQNEHPSVRALALVALAGVLLAGVLLATSSLYAATAAHLAWNWILVGVMHAAVSGATLPTPDYTVVDAGPDWMTGGPWGPEGGAAAGVGMAAALVYLYARRRRPPDVPPATGDPRGATRIERQ